ncbi:unnamed protein product, partial [marine sediment metagenome]
MKKLEDKLIERANELIELGNEVLSSKKQYLHVVGESVDETFFAEFRTSCLSFLKRTFELTSPYYIDFETRVRKTDPLDVERGI